MTMIRVSAHDTGEDDEADDDPDAEAKRHHVRPPAVKRCT
jgi:hypothetical protein